MVGRNNRQNDQLTFHLTGPNHLWLHARGTPGSHVAVLAEGDIPNDTLLLAAQLAAYFSAQRNSPKAEVDYTLRKYVRKPKGAKPGFVHYEWAKTIVVNPSEFIPHLNSEDKKQASSPRSSTPAPCRSIETRSCLVRTLLVYPILFYPLLQIPLSAVAFFANLHHLYIRPLKSR